MTAIPPRVRIGRLAIGVQVCGHSGMCERAAGHQGALSGRLPHQRRTASGRLDQWGDDGAPSPDAEVDARWRVLHVDGPTEASEAGVSTGGREGPERAGWPSQPQERASGTQGP